MADINDLPDEILIRIFHYYLQTESQYNFVNLLSNVCKKWRDVSMDSSNFPTVDGTLGLRTAISLAKAGAFKNAKAFTFGILKGKQKNPFSMSLRDLYANLPLLKTLDVSKVCTDFERKKEHPVFTDLKDHCPDLCELILGNPQLHCQTKISNLLFTELLQLRGHKLVSIDLSYINMPCLRKLLSLIAKCCPNLEDLMMQDLNSPSISFNFPAEEMQLGCPKLRTLRLGCPHHIMTKCGLNPPGFPHLRIFTHPYRDDHHFNDTAFSLLLSKSPELKILDIRGTLQVRVDTVFNLPADHLEQLYLSRSRVTKMLEMVILLQKWSTSLKVLDISHTTGDRINSALGPASLPDGLPELEELDINNTSISLTTLQYVIRTSPKLKLLHLDLCRRLGRGQKHTYRSREEIEELLKPEVIDLDFDPEILIRKRRRVNSETKAGAKKGAH